MSENEKLYDQTQLINALDGGTLSLENNVLPDILLSNRRWITLEFQTMRLTSCLFWKHSQIQLPMEKVREQP